MSNVVELIFSPTGGTEKVANQLGNSLGKVKEVVHLNRYGVDFTDVKIEKEDLVVIAAPVFEAVIPDTAIERIKEIRGNGANCVVVAVYGNRAYDDGLIQLKDTAELCGFQVVAAIAAVAEHSIMRQFGTGRPDSEDIKDLQAFAEKIKKKLTENEKVNTDYFVPGNHEYKRIGNLNVVPKANGKCVKCGKCADACPVGAITRTNMKTGDSSRCISCMACIAACPVKARKLNGLLLTVASAKMKPLLSGRKPNEIFL